VEAGKAAANYGYEKAASFSAAAYEAMFSPNPKDTAATPSPIPDY
jgi:hypothetical protein